MDISYNVTILALKVADVDLVDTRVVDLEDLEYLEAAKANLTKILKTVKIRGNRLGAIEVSDCLIPTETEFLAFKNSTRGGSGGPHTYKVYVNGWDLSVTSLSSQNRFMVKVSPPAPGQLSRIKLYRAEPKKMYSYARYRLNELPAEKNYISIDTPY